MILQRKRGLQATVLICQSALALLLFGLCAAGTFARIDDSVADEMVWHYITYSVVIVGGLVVESVNRSRITTRIGGDFLKQHRLSVRQTAYAAGLLLIYLAAMKDAFISRAFLAMFIPLLYLGLLWSNRWMPKALAQRIFGGVREERTLLIGYAAKAARLKCWLRSKELFGLRTVGTLSDAAEVVGNHIEGFCYLGPSSDVERVIREFGITQVIVLELPQSVEAHRKLVEIVERNGVRLLIVSNLEEKLNHSIVYIEDDGHRFITLREEPLA